METLLQLVPKHLIKSHWSDELNVMTRERIDWIAIADKLNRIPKDCKRRWLKHKYSKLNRGPFTAEEDELILQRVAEWGNKGNGLWVGLMQEMGRPPVCISCRWRYNLDKQRSGATTQNDN